MSNGHSYTRGKVVAITGVPNDVFTFWLRSSLIRPLNPDREKAKMPLKFGPGQVRLVAILNKVRAVGLNVDAMRALSDVFQRSEDWIDRHNLSASDWEQLANERERQAVLSFDLDAHDAYMDEHYGGNAARATRKRLRELTEQEVPVARFERAITDLKHESASVQEVAMAILAKEGVIGLRRGDDEEWVVDRLSSLDAGLGADAGIVFDLARILPAIQWEG